MLTLAELKATLADILDTLVADALLPDADAMIADLLRANGPEQMVQAIGVHDASGTTLTVDGLIVRDIFHAILAPRAADDRRLLALAGAVLRRYADACRTNAATRQELYADGYSIDDLTAAGARIAALAGEVAHG
jgi:hypothetical protein